MNTLAYHLVDHCNLLCSGCNHFSPLAKKRFADINLFEKNINLLLSYVSNIGEINLLGGEPLLHPQIEEFCKITRKYFSKKINIWTNGILLPKMKQTFYDTLDQYDIKIIETNYGIIKNKNNVRVDTTKNGYVYKFITHNNTEQKCSFFKKEKITPLQLNENGDLFFCCIPANIHFYNDHYNESFEVIKNVDFININEVKNKIDVVKFLLNPKRNFCKYCCKPEIKEWHTFTGEDEWKK